MSDGDVRLGGQVWRIEAEPLTDDGDDAVVRTPGRRFPGVLVRGDSFYVLRRSVTGSRRPRSSGRGARSMVRRGFGTDRCCPGLLVSEDGVSCHART
ncbi:DUF6959 family protein [Streptomyces fuscichromogenes]|uniref:DUF6959 family protein n=1 Tax=Streptomyces fuscichromogenes TaxID=1324013 RepID=UPI003570BE22